MNSLSFVLLVTCVLLIHGEELTDECRHEMLTKSYQADDCLSKLATPSGSLIQILDEFNRSTINFNDNMVDFQELELLIDQICVVLPKYSHCSLLGFNISADCTILISGLLRKLMLEEISAFFMQAWEQNNCDIVKKLIPYNGLKFLVNNKDLENCINMTLKITDMGDFCSSIERTYICIEQTVGDHPNKNIMVVVRDIISRFKEAKCT